MLTHTFTHTHLSHLYESSGHMCVHTYTHPPHTHITEGDLRASSSHLLSALPYNPLKKENAISKVNLYLCVCV